ncbi:alpha-glucosidase, partial [Tremellales sp. Uapishka_1]
MLFLPVLAGIISLVSAAPTSRKSPLGSGADVQTVLSQNTAFSGDITQCKGYSVGAVTTSSTGGILAPLTSLGQCNAYATDIQSLVLSVEYETTSRLHVHIYDSALHQFQVPDDFLPRPNATLSGPSAIQESDLEFAYNSSPFEFWVTRKTDGQVLFDTRAVNIPTHLDPVQIEGNYSNWTILPSYPLVFEDQYLQIASALPVGANIYGLGEHIASSGYRRNSSATIQTFWARDVGDPVDENMFPDGSHNMYMETRWNDTTSSSKSHGVFFLNSNGMDVILQDGVIEYRAIGGTIDLCKKNVKSSAIKLIHDSDFLSGGTPNDVAAQYAQTVGLPQAMPFWSFGFHLCRWGYTSLAETRSIVDSMRSAGIPLEVQWNDIDWMRHYREFQFDDNFSPAEYKSFIDYLHSNNQHYIPIIDAAIGILYNDTDSYDVYERGHELGVWTKNSDGTEYIGSVWPGYTVFPDWMNPSMAQVWGEAFYNYSQVVDFDGIWLDMNEPSSFVDGSASNSTVALNATLLQPSPEIVPPTRPDSWPEGYDNFTSGISGNLTLNGTLTYGANGSAPTNTAMRRHIHDLSEIQRNIDLTLKAQKQAAVPQPSFQIVGDLNAAIVSTTTEKRQIGSYVPSIANVDVPGYPIRNGNDEFLRLSHNTISPNATLYGGLQEYSIHNLWGSMEEIATNNVLYNLKPGIRPFIVARSTFAGVGRKTAHWLGDNYSTWAYMKRSIAGVLQFNLFAIPSVGPDTCGFASLSLPLRMFADLVSQNGNTDEELCNRWMQLSAFFPFYRNHNTKGAISQEPFRWDSVAAASIKAIQARYTLLPYWLTLFAEAAEGGSPPMRALFYEFDNKDYYDNDYQFLVGPSILVTPQLQPNQSTVTGQFPNENGVFWYDWWTHEKMQSGGEQTVPAGLGEIPVHVRSGSVLLLHDSAEYTLTETRESGYAMLVTLDGKGYAEGVAKIDDGLSWPVNATTCLTLVANSSSCLSSTPSGDYQITQQLKTVTILGVDSQPASVTFNGQQVSNITYTANTQEVVVTGLGGDLNSAWELKW